MRYEPYAELDKLQAATLIVDAADEELFDIKRNGVDLYARIKDRIPSAYHALPGKHYDIYRGGYHRAVALQKAWLQKHLPPAQR